MKIQHVKISNILGIEHLEFSPEGFTSIAGPNGRGKTSVLEAIKAATGVGHDATLLRQGAEKGEIVLVLDDGTEIQQRVTAGRTTRDVVRDGKKIARPGDAIKALTDALSVNPVEFLTARKQDRVKVLLESMPIQLDDAKLAQISGVPVPTGGLHPLHAIEAVRKQVFDDRTGTNRAVKEKDATINQLLVAMPDAPGGVEGDEDTLSQQLQQAQDDRDSELKRIDTKIAGVRQTSAEAIQRLKDEGQARIDAIRAEVQSAIDAEREKLAGIESKAARQHQRTMDAFMTAAAPLSEAISVIRLNRDAVAKRKATQETISTMQRELEDLIADAKRQTAALDAIDAYKSELLASLPIPGLEVIDGEVFRDGIPFDRLNTAQRVGIAFEIAKLRAGELKMICLDGMELLDADSLQAMRERAAEDDVQVFITRVQDSEFSVETE